MLSGWIQHVVFYHFFTTSSVAISFW